MRNLTKEAMQMAERDAIEMWPALRDRQVRVRLSSFDRQTLVNFLLGRAAFYEESLIMEATN